jgi:hypothetical protein
MAKEEELELNRQLAVRGEVTAGWGRSGGDGREAVPAAPSIQT